jgi:phosphotransferase system  glucose/maltose/N-acetylglucosamine-specific IIC component
MTKLFSHLLALIWLAPVLFAALGVVLSSKLRSGKWIVHGLVFAAMLLALSFATYLGGVLDPTTIEYPGTGEGFGIVLYLIMMIASALYYAAFAWVTYRKQKQS